MEGRELGQSLFERDRLELFDCTLIYLKGRFDSLLSHEVLRWMRDFLEHRRWPAKDDPALDSWGTDALAQFANHFSGLSSLAEAQSEFSLLKKELREEPCFLFSYKKFLEACICSL